VTVGPLDTLAHAKSIMDAGRFRRVPVVEAGLLVGILSDRDIREHGGYLVFTLVSGAMHSELITLKPTDTVETAARLMLKHKIGGIPVVDERLVIGIVTTTDLLKAFLTVVQSTREIMNG
jgi:acetoin utilization protein AcuB